MAQEDVGGGGHGNSNDNNSVQLPRDRWAAATLDTAAPVRSGKSERGSGERARMTGKLWR